MAKLKVISIYEWENAMKQLKDHTKECIRANGDSLYSSVPVIRTPVIRNSDHPDMQK